MKAAPETEERIRQFLQDKNLYQLGVLSTEQGHPLTKNLSQLAVQDLGGALKVLRQVDLEALDILRSKEAEIFQMAQAVRQARERGGRIFLGGCGATGRLSVALERLVREIQGREDVIGFMAGGDVAFVHAIEGFEDFPDYGARQLMDLGFSEKDLFFGITEGGETPFVIGATQKATEVSHHKCFFLYCNPTDLLTQNVERSKKILANPKVQGVCLHVGPMALAGSTRMQASTVLMMAAGLALLYPGHDQNELRAKVDELIEVVNDLDLGLLSRYVDLESDVYKRMDATLYRVREFSNTVFTDTTERAPTFSLASFDNKNHPQQVHSLTYVSVAGSHNSDEAWAQLFLRSPRTLEWSGDFVKTKRAYLDGFDFSEHAKEFREGLMPDCEHHIFSIERGVRGGVTFSFRGELSALRLSSDIFLQNLALKMILNAHSTTVMGRLGRYESHYMTYVRPNNGKLIDRAVRYARSLIEWRGGRVPPYDDVVKTLLTYQAELAVNQSVVLKTVQHYLANSTA